MNLPSPTIRVGVAHRDALIHSGIEAALREMRDVEVEAHATELHGSASASTLIVVADIESAAALLAKTQRSPSQPRPLVIAAGADREWELRKALAHNARGYLVEGFSIGELGEALHAVQRGALYLCQRAAARLAQSVRFEALTDREAEVLRLVALGMCNKTVSKQLAITVGTVKAHLKSTFGKLNVDSRTQAVIAAQRRGLFRRDDDLPNVAAGERPSSAGQRLQISSGFEDRAESEPVNLAF